MGWRVRLFDRVEVSSSETYINVRMTDESLMTIRISPFPPHWVANVVAPHLDISPLLFWCACFIGIGPVSVIHVTIGSGLDKMTSAEDFHILSLRNVLGLIGIGVAVMIPTALKSVEIDCRRGPSRSIDVYLVTPSDGSSKRTFPGSGRTRPSFTNLISMYTMSPATRKPIHRKTIVRKRPPSDQTLRPGTTLNVMPGWV